MGKWKSANVPANVMTREMTMAKTRRCRKTGHAARILLRFGRALRDCRRFSRLHNMPGRTFTTPSAMTRSPAFTPPVTMKKLS